MSYVYNLIGFPPETPPLGEEEDDEQEAFPCDCEECAAERAASEVKCVVCPAGRRKGRKTPVSYYLTRRFGWVCADHYKPEMDAIQPDRAVT